MSPSIASVKHVGRQATQVGYAVVDGLLNRNPEATIEGQDGFVAYCPGSGEVLHRYRGGAAVHTQTSNHPEHVSIENLLKHPYPGQHVTFSIGNRQVTPDTETNHKGVQLCPSGLMPETVKRLDPTTGGLLQVAVSTPLAGQSEARILALPDTYDGPIFVCDLDQTVRATSFLDFPRGRTPEPIPGAAGLLSALAAKKVPLVYLSAGSTRLHNANRAFLAQLPDGVLLDRSQTGKQFWSPRNATQTMAQAAYKSDVLHALREAYPQAHIFGLGDDKYGDALAYTAAGATAYIHSVDGKHHNVPADFGGVVTTDGYTPEFQDRIVSDVQQCIDDSASFNKTEAEAPRWLRDHLAASRASLSRMGHSCLRLLSDE